MERKRPGKNLYPIAARLRLGTALLVLALFLLAYAGHGRKALLTALLGAQLSPALIRGGLIAVAAALAPALLFGRLYCSVACPMGTLQEVLWRIPRLRGGVRRRVRPWRARYLVPILAGAGAAFGLTPLMIGLDPVSLFGRGVRGIAALLRGETPAAGVAVSSLVVFALILLLSLLRGRRFCDWCPVGVALGLCAPIAPLGMRIAEGRCVSCGLCERVCPTNCVDAERKRLSRERCVLCLNCASVCPTGAAGCGIALKAAPGTGEGGGGRRKFLADGGRFALGALAAAAYFGGLSSLSASPGGGGFPRPPGGGARDAAGEPGRALPILPPGAGDYGRYDSRCIGCQACAAACPAGIVVMKDSPHPVLDYGNGYCQFNCADCANACPTGALRPLSVEAKRRTRVALSKLNAARCVVAEKRQACGACAEVCPTHALRMQPYAEAEGLPLPIFDEEYCIGCGACLFACPVTDEPRAFEIAGVPRQTTTRGIRPSDEGEISLPGMGDDFPF